MSALPNRITFVIAVCSFLGFSASAQIPDSLPVSRGAFINSLGQYVTANKQQKQQEIFDAFATQFRGNVFSEEEYQTIRHTANIMLKLRMTAHGYFGPYLESLTAIKRSAHEPEQFEPWHEIINGILTNSENRKFKPFRDFLLFSVDFFNLRTLRYSKSGNNWFAEADKYYWSYQDKNPSICFDSLALIGRKGQEEIRIDSTSGCYYPIDLRWEGEGGRVDWHRLEVDKAIHCKLQAYTIDTRRNFYEAIDVNFFHPELFPDGPVKGTLTDKLVIQNKATEGSYPRFESSQEPLVIGKFGEGLVYQGGFRLHGTTVYGNSTEKAKASIQIYGKDGSLSYVGLADLFIIRRHELIAGEQVESSILFGQDSIYHPSVNIKYNIPERELSLYKGERGSDQNPFYDSFHKVNIYTDKLDWFVDKDSMVINQKRFNIGNGSQRIMVESVNYYDSRDYRRIQNVANVNPLAMIKALADEEGTMRLDANQLAKKINPRFDVTSIQSLLYDLVSQGFINYYHDRQLVEVKEKVFHYANASQDKVDYDVLKLISETEETNAFFDVSEKKITTGGIKILEFSSKQEVAVKPTGDQIILRQNRNMDFDGKLFAGVSNFVGKDFSFNYEKFYIEMDSIRYLDLFMKTNDVDEHFRPVYHSIGSRLEHGRGILLIDAPSNKSGKEDIPMFPSFQSTGPFYVYYDNPETQKGGYIRDSFYFKLDKFSFNSLDNYAKEDLSFKGNLISAGIFPPIKETISLQEFDYSLGFQAKTPEEGYKSYGDRGTFKGQLNLNNQGLQANGKLDYLWASIDSEDIVFMPEKMLGSADQFNLEEDRRDTIQVPQVRGADVSIDWRPYKDSMYVFSKDTPFGLFKADGYTLKGRLVLTPGGLKGQGVFDWDEGRLKSELISFGAFSAKADTTDLQIKAVDSDNLAFDTENVYANMNFEKQEGYFKSIDSVQVTTMPHNKYLTTMNEFTWDMKGKTVDFKSPEGRLSTFTSIHPDQDSLTFKGKTAFYDMTTSKIQIGGVPEILSADALIIPDSNAVEIQPGGLINTLNNAKIIANTENRYHVINRAKVDIKGKRLYSASGFYEFNVGPHQQEIYFANILGQPVGKGQWSEKNTVTRATGEITPEDNFFIDHKTEYRGQIALTADEPNLQFDGFARLQLPLIKRRDWFSIKSKGDKNDLVISFNEPKNYEGEPLRTGLFISKETGKLYPNIMTPLSFRKDRVIMDAKGAFRYDHIKDQFVFGDSTRVTKMAKSGSLMTYDNKTAQVEARGPFHIGSGLDVIKVKAGGRVKTAFGGIELPDGKVTSDAMQGDFMIGIDLQIPEKLLRIMITDIQSSSFDAEFVNYSDYDFFETALAEWIPDPGVLFETMETLKTSRSLTMPQTLNSHTFFFSHIPMIWDTDYQSFISKGEKLGLHSILGQYLDRKVTAFVEFKMPSSEDDRLYMYIKSPSEYYYYFHYKQGVLSVVSNNMRFNEIIENMKEKERIIELKSGGSYEIQPINPGTAETFVRRVKASWQPK